MNIDITDKRVLKTTLLKYDLNVYVQETYMNSSAIRLRL